MMNSADVDDLLLTAPTDCYKFFRLSGGVSGPTFEITAA